MMTTTKIGNSYIPVDTLRISCKPGKSPTVLLKSRITSMLLEVPFEDSTEVLTEKLDRAVSIDLLA